MKRFTSLEADNMRQDMERALAEVAKKYGAVANVGNIRYGDNLSTKITFSKMSENKHGEFVMTKEAKTFLARAESLGFRKDVLGETLIYRGKAIVITGYNTRARTYPISYTENGDRYKCSEGQMKKMVFEVKPEWVL